MRREVRTCRDLKRECDMEVERAMVHHGLDGRVFWVQRLGCANCGRQALTAREQTDPDDMEVNF